MDSPQVSFDNGVSPCAHNDFFAWQPLKAIWLMNAFSLSAA